MAGRKSKSPAKISIHEIRFSGFELPMKHKETILDAMSVKEINVVPVGYYIVKTFNASKGDVEFKAVVKLPKKHILFKDFDKVKKLFEDVGEDFEFADTDEGRYLILSVPENSELVKFIERVERKVSEFEKISANDVFHVGVARDEIYIDKTSSAPITVKKSHIPSDSELVAFVLNNFDMPKFWFKVEEYAVILGDYDAISLRFKCVARKRETIDSNRIIVSYAIPSGDNPVNEAIKLRIEDDIEKLKAHDEFYRNLTRAWVERAVEKYTPELKTEIMDIIDDMLKKKSLKVITSKEYGNKFFVEVITPDGRLYSEDFIPEFVLKKIVKTYYDNLLFQLLRIYVSEAKELMRSAPSIENITEEEKKGFLDSLLKVFKKEEKKVEVSDLMPEDEGEVFIDIAKDYVEEN